MEKKTEYLRTVAATLESLTVSGRENMAKLLGCISALEEIIKEVEENG